jgi:hypothetical protein
MTDNAINLDDAVADMAAWLGMMLRPVDWDEVDTEPYPYVEMDDLELGGRVADDLLTEWAWRSPESLAVVLVQRVERRR